MGSAAAEITAKARHIASLIQGARVSRAIRPPPPLMVSIQGPRGCGEYIWGPTGPLSIHPDFLTKGKSSLAAALVPILKEVDNSTLISSLDDFSFPCDKLTTLGANLSSMPGMPGTYDTDLLSSVIDEVGKPWSFKRRTVELPTLDPTLRDKAPDRSPSRTAHLYALNVFILEGWCLGYRPLPLTELYHRYTNSKLAVQRPWEEIRRLNTTMGELDDALQGEDLMGFHVHIRLMPEFYEDAYEWAVERERKVSPGSREEHVKRDVDLCMGVHEIWGDTVPFWPTLDVLLDRKRAIVSLPVSSYTLPHHDGSQRNNDSPC